MKLSHLEQEIIIKALCGYIDAVCWHQQKVTVQEDVSGPSFEDLARGLDKEPVESDGSFIYCVEAADDKPYADGHPYDKLPCYDCSVCGKRYRVMVAARECCKKGA